MQTGMSLCSFIMFLVCLPLFEWKHCEGQDLSLCSLMYLKHLEQCLHISAKFVE